MLTSAAASRGAAARRRRRSSGRRRHPNPGRCRPRSARAAPRRPVRPGRRRRPAVRSRRQRTPAGAGDVRWPDPAWTGRAHESAPGRGWSTGSCGTAATAPAGRPCRGPGRPGLDGAPAAGCTTAAGPRPARRRPGEAGRALAARDEERRRADAHAAELERLRAEGDVASGRDRTDLSYLFVVTYGRSGSTLLQGILSSVPGVMIRGENGGVVGHLFRFHDTARTHRDRLARPGGLPPSHPWWGIDGYPDAAALRNMRRLLLETVLRPAPTPACSASRRSTGRRTGCRRSCSSCATCSPGPVSC